MKPPFDKQQVAIAARVLNGMPEGRLFISYILWYTHIFETSMPMDCNPNMTLFNEGQRSVGNEVVSLVVNEPDRFKVDTIRKIAAQAEGKTS